ncbi:MAG: response regulator transcription factor [Saprospiraceae bacterium]
MHTTDSHISMHNQLTCLAIDDEPPALKILESHIKSFPSLKLIASCNNAIEALQQIQQHPIDLLFLDIQMPQILGTDLIRSISNPPKVIFTTAYRKYAVDGFDLNAVDYLLKPISFERFLKAVNKVMNIHFSEIQNDHQNKTKIAAQIPDHIDLRVDRQNVKINLKDIYYIESLKDYLKVVLEKTTLVTKMSIQNIETLLPANTFVRVHRSFIIALPKISSFTQEVIHIHHLEIPISRTYRLSFLKAIEQKK